MKAKIFTISLLLLFVAFSVCYAANYTDMDLNSYPSTYSEAMMTLEKNEAIKGYPDGTFKPANSITRAEVVKVLVNAYGIKLSSSNENMFSDVPDGAWYKDYVYAGTTNGFIKGYEDKTFRPNENVSYVELVAMLCRLEKINVRDSKEGENWYTPYWNTADEAGFFTNYASNDLLPNNKARRDSVVLLVYNAINHENESIPTKPEEKGEKKEEYIEKFDTSKTYMGVVESFVEERGNRYVIIDCFGEGKMKLQIVKLDKTPSNKSLVIYKIKSNGNVTLKKEFKAADIDKDYLEIEEIDEGIVAFKGTDEYLDILEKEFNYNSNLIKLNKIEYYNVSVDLSEKDEYEFSGCEKGNLSIDLFETKDRVLFDTTNKMCFIIRGILEKE